MLMTIIIKIIIVITMDFYRQEIKKGNPRDFKTFKNVNFFLLENSTMTHLALT